MANKTNSKRLKQGKWSPKKSETTKFVTLFVLSVLTMAMIFQPTFAQDGVYLTPTPAIEIPPFSTPVRFGDAFEPNQNELVVIPGTVEMVVPLDAIPSEILDYGCVPPDDGWYCLSVGDSLLRVITHTMYREGGGGDLQTAVNLLQILQNQAYYAWTCAYRDNCSSKNWEALNPNKIPWEQITQDQFNRLVLYLITAPYKPNTTAWPSFNGYCLPLNMGAIESQPLLSRMWAANESMIERWLQDAPGKPQQESFIYIEDWEGVRAYPAKPIITYGVMYVYASYNETKDIPSVYVDILRSRNDTIYIYYYNYSGVTP